MGIPAAVRPARRGRDAARFFPGRDDLIRAFAPAAAWALLALALFGLFGGWLLAGRMLAPLTRITTATRAAATGSLSHRIDLQGANDEFRELADSFDAMLAKLEAQVEEQRRFAANASHELRTPLAITQTLLEVARSDPGVDRAELVERLHSVNARAIELTQALLVLSRAEQRSFAPEPVDLSLLAEEATETLLPLAETHGVEIETSGDLAIVDGSPTLLLQLVTNLVHNAIVHNLAEGGHVGVETSAHQGQVMLAVENTGEPLDPTLVSTLTERFRRGTDRVRRDQAGVGGSVSRSWTASRVRTGAISPGRSRGRRTPGRRDPAVRGRSARRGGRQSVMRHAPMNWLGRGGTASSGALDRLRDAGGLSYRM